MSDLVVHFLCPDCGLTCMADGNNGSVLHSLPMCETFEALEPDQFLVLARKKWVGPMPCDDEEVS